MPLVETLGLRKTYPSGGGLVGLTLSIAEGQTYGFVGPDGAGKTTLLRILCGILRPTAGEVKVLGVDVRRRPESVKPHLGYMAQRFALYGDLTVLENLRFFGALFGTPRTEVEENLERLLNFAQLWPFRSRLAKCLSGGMKQKLALCCTLIHTPRLLILDEPTIGVDPVSRQEFWSMLQPLPARGTSIVVSTGYLEEAERCDRVAFLHQGGLLMEGPPEDLRASFDGMLLEVCGDDLRGAKRVLEALAIVDGVQLFGDRLHLFLRHAQTEMAVAGIEAALNAAGLAGASIRAIKPRLEDIFIERLSAGKESPRHDCR